MRIDEAITQHHILPRHVPNSLILREIDYQTTLHGFNYMNLVRDMHRNCIPYNKYIGHYGLARYQFEKI